MIFINFLFSKKNNPLCCSILQNNTLNFYDLSTIDFIKFVKEVLNNSTIKFCYNLRNIFLLFETKKIDTSLLDNFIDIRNLTYYSYGLTSSDLEIENIYNKYKKKVYCYIDQYFSIKKSRINNFFKDENLPVILTKKISNQFVQFLYDYYSENVHSSNKNFDFYLKTRRIKNVIFEIEKNGLLFDKKKLLELKNNIIDENTNKDIRLIEKNNYNIHFPYDECVIKTGRLFSKSINLSNKIKNCLKSRFENGFIIEFDYHAMDFMVLCNIVNFKDFFKVSDLYNYITTLLKLKNRDQCKRFVYQCLYGESFIEACSKFDVNYYDFVKLNASGKLPFNDIQEFKNKLINQFNDTKKIFDFYGKEIEVEEKNKILSHYAQSTSSTVIIKSMLKIHDFLKYKESKMIMYNYDSLVFDIKNEEIDFVKNISEMMKNTKINNNEFATNYKIIC